MMTMEQGIRTIPGLFDQLNFSESTSTLAKRYREAKPYPHVIMDDLFQPELLDELLDEMSRSRKSDWLEYNTQELDKRGQKSAIGLGKAGQQMVSMLHSAPFLYLLSEITEVWNLLPDPYIHGAGYSVIPPRGKFNVHVDLNADVTNGLVRRMALLIYLNKDWKSEYGGELELWNADATERVCSIEPHFNRAVLMEISETGYHGINPVVEPTGRSRHSFMLYFNTAGEILDRDSGVHTSIYAPSCYKAKPTVTSMVRRVTPPVLYDFLRAKIK
jgi:hypothetical protein